ncbi:sulfotransferase 1C4-like isoform X2 [Oratosquilla oratoria]
MEVKLENGHEVVPLEGEEMETMEKDFQGYTEGMVLLKPGDWMLPTPYLQFANDIYNFKFRPTDIVVMGYPKCGITWAQEILWTIKNNPNFDHPMAALPVNARSPFLDMDMLLISKKMPPPSPDNPMIKALMQLCSKPDFTKGISLQICEANPNPRIIKTHLPFSLLNPKLLETTKVVYMVRNPKDMSISYHHQHRIIKGHGFAGDMDKFVDYLVKDRLLYGMYFKHLKEAWERKDHPNLQMFFYEDLKKDPKGEIKKMDKFIEGGMSDDQIQKIVDYTTFEQMALRDKPTGIDETECNALFDKDVAKKEGGFYRRGDVGDYKNILNADQEAKIDAWTKKNMEGIDLTFKYSL